LKDRQSCLETDASMSDEETPEHSEPRGPGDAQSGIRPQSEEIVHSQVSAVVPERVARGVFSTGVVVVQGAHEFILDFLLRMTSPHQLAARVVLPFAVVERLIFALRENLKHYERKFGPLPPARVPAETPQKTSAEELYEQIKIRDDVLSGTYANAVMIGHSPTEFSFDFITTFYPRSAVACRVFMTAPNVPRMLDSLTHSYEQFKRKQAGNKEPPAGQS
jgi:hypothetical protein